MALVAFAASTLLVAPRATRLAPTALLELIPQPHVIGLCEACQRLGGEAAAESKG